MSKVVKLKERMLFLYSETIKGYPWLENLLSENHTLSQDQIQNLPLDQRSFFETQMFKQVSLQAEKEWKADKSHPFEDMGEEKENWKQCSLCHTPNRYIFYIVNQLNSNSLNVGKECIEYFGIDLGISTSQIIKEYKQTKRLVELNKVFPGIKTIVDRWDQEIDSFPIVIPDSMTRPYIKAGEHLRENFEGYIEGKYSEELYPTMQLYLDTYTTAMSQFEKYVKENVSKSFIATRPIALWLRNNGETQAFDMIKKSGFIIWGSLYRIGEPIFLNSLIPDLNSHLHKIGYIIEKLNTNYKGSKGYVIRPLKHRGIRLIAKTKDLLFHFGGLLFNEELIIEMVPANLINLTKLYDENSVIDITRQLSKLLRNKGFELYKSDIDYNEAFFLIIATGEYIKVKLDQLAEEFKGLALGVNAQNVDTLVRFIESNNRRLYTKDELEDTDEVRDDFDSAGNWS